MCVGSNGLVASRRKIILQNPSDEDLNKTKFCGVPLGQYMSSSLKNTSQLLKYIFSKIKEVAIAMDTDITNEMLQEVEDYSDLFVYGEWIHRDCQTSDSKLDKYIYKDRGICPGHLYVFGIGIAVKFEALNSSTHEKIDASKLIHWVSCIKDDTGNDKEMFIVQQCLDVYKNPFIVLFINPLLKRVVERFEFETVPILGQYPSMKQAIIKFGGELVPPVVSYEGVIFTGIHLEGAIKLKNPIAEGNNPSNSERYKMLEKHVQCNNQDPNILSRGPYDNEVMLMKIRNLVDYHSSSKGSINHQSIDSDALLQLEIAYQSAKTKFPHFSDDMIDTNPDTFEAQDGLDQNEKLEMYKISLRKEMMGDIKSNSPNVSLSISYLDNYLSEKLSSEKYKNVS